MKLLDYARYNMGCSAGMLRRLKGIERGVILNGEEAYLTRRISKNDKISILISVNKDGCDTVIPSFGNVDIIYEDDDLFVINKEAGVSVHPSMGHQGDTLANFLAYELSKRGQKMVFRPINRLDKGTSGLMVVAKNPYAQEGIIRQMKQGLVKKEYLAIVQGEVMPKSGLIDAPIARAEGSVLKRQVNKNGDSAQTYYEVMAKAGDYTLLKVLLKTGRTHQIRVHMAYIGYPLVGDFLYGTEQQELISRHALHSTALSFIQPVTKERLSFRIPLPSDMKRVLMTGKGTVLQ